MDYLKFNLSQKPFYDVKKLVIFTSFLYFIAIVLTSFTAYKVYNFFKFSEDSEAKIIALSEELKKYQEENNKLNRELSIIDKKKIVETSEVINNLIKERSFSWSKLLQELEGTLPEDVRLMSLSTSGSTKGNINIRISALSSKRDGMLKTVDALKEKKVFFNVKPNQFQDEERSPTIGKRFDIQFNYKGEESDGL